MKIKRTLKLCKILYRKNVADENLHEIISILKLANLLGKIAINIT